jgi:hypothetical protein
MDEEVWSDGDTLESWIRLVHPAFGELWTDARQNSASVNVQRHLQLLFAAESTRHLERLPHGRKYTAPHLLLPQWSSSGHNIASLSSCNITTLPDQPLNTKAG